MKPLHPIPKAKWRKAWFGGLKTAPDVAKSHFSHWQNDEAPIPENAEIMAFSGIFLYNGTMKKKELQTSNTEETVTISRAEYERLQKGMAEIQQQNQWLLEQLGLAKKRQFGSSSERMQEEMMEQFALTYNEAEANAYGTKTATEEQIRVKEHARRHSGSIEDVIPEGLPVETIEHHPDDIHCPVCGTEMVVIGKEVRKTLKITPPQYSVVEDVYYTYACKTCEEETDEAVIVKTPKEPAVIPGSFASPEAIAHIMVQKYVMYAPLYRQEQEMRRAGIKLSRQTTSSWILSASDTWLRPIYDELHKKLVQSTVLHADETTLQVLKEPGRPSTSKSYMWLYRTSGDAEHPIVLYEYKPNRKPENAENFLKGFTGWLHADGYQGYHRLPEQIRIVGCWAHARRKFDEALQVLTPEARKDSQAAIGECYCTKLFQLEQELAECTPEERYTKRLEQEKPVLDALLSWANELQPKTAGKSALGKALHYLLEQWPYLVRYLEDGRLELSNNRAERSIKPFVMGRKNWLFANTPAGAQSSSVIYSLIETAKENGLDPYRYLLWILREAPKAAKNDADWPRRFLPEAAPGSCKTNT